jgi:dolichol-phosphate mannosyltransferase
MPSAPEVSYVLPAWNEAANIEKAVRSADAACREFTDRHEILVVDDGSRDETPKILERLEEEIPPLRVIRLDTNAGYSNALRTGFLAARHPWVFFTDADNQFDPREIARFLAVRADSDLVIGYRVARKDGLLRHLLSRGYGNLQMLLLGLRVRDINCAFKLFRRSLFDVIPIESEGFLVNAEILARADRLGLRTRQLPVGHRPRVAGRTTISWKSVPETIRGAFRLRGRLRGWPPAELVASLPEHGLGPAVDAGRPAGGTSSPEQ